MLVFVIGRNFYNGIFSKLIFAYMHISEKMGLVCAIKWLIIGLWEIDGTFMLTTNLRAESEDYRSIDTGFLSIYRYNFEKSRESDFIDIFHSMTSFVW